MVGGGGGIGSHLDGTGGSVGEGVVTGGGGAGSLKSRLMGGVGAGLLAMGGGFNETAGAGVGTLLLT